MFDGESRKEKGFFSSEKWVVEKMYKWLELVDLWQKGGDEKNGKIGVNFAKSKWQNEKSEENLTIFAEKWHFSRRIFGQVRKK